MRPRTEMHKVQELVRLHREGAGAREVARLLGISPNTERFWRRKLAAAGLLDGPVDPLPDLELLDGLVPQRRPRQQTSTVEAHEARIRQLRVGGAGPKAIYDRLRMDDPGFGGSYWAVKRLCARLDRAAPPKATDVAIPVETLAGAVAQVDFGYAGRMVDPATGTLRRAWVFVMVLAHSRHMFVRCVFRQDAATWQQLHVEAFIFFGGVPLVVVPDNLKAAVIRGAFELGSDPALNRSYVALARHFGFKVDPTPPRSPTKKGKVERAVQYVKRNPLATLPEQIDIRAANGDVDRWVIEIAGQRMHSRTGRRPLEMFLAEEQPALLPLPTRPFVPVVWKQAKVHRDSHLMFERRLYSVPWAHLGKGAWVRATPTTVTIYVDDVRVAEHPRRGGAGRSTVESHLPEHRRDLRHRGRDWWLQRARAIGPQTELLAMEIFDDEDVLSPLRSVQAIVTHLADFPGHRAEAAAKRASHFGVHRYRGIRDMLRQGIEAEPLPTQLPFPEAGPPSDGPSYRFTRSIHEMLSQEETKNEYH